MGTAPAFRAGGFLATFRCCHEKLLTFGRFLRQRVACPTPGAMLPPGGALQMMFRHQSLAVTKLDLFFHDVPLGSATGFLYASGQNLALVSNWHVFSCVNALTGINLDTGRGFVPNRVEFYISLLDPRTQSVLFRPQNVTFVDNRHSLWWQHEEYRDLKRKPKIVDIGVLVLNDRIVEFASIKDQIVALPSQLLVHFDETGKARSFKHPYPRVAAELFIVGYPMGLSKQGAFPIWKRGSVASEPLFPVMGVEPMIFIDAATHKGMSGSPVLYFGNEITDEFGDPIPEAERTPNEPWLVGVYAGREAVTDEENKMTIGRVWRKSLLDEIFFQQVPGRLHIPNP
jgi:hypothetical protein